MAKKPKQTYLRKVLRFYFAPLWRTMFVSLYFLFFAYFVIFYADYLVLSARFLYYTLTLPTPQLTLDYLFWGAAYAVLLIVPLAVSLYALIIPFELMKKLDWTKKQKILVALMILVATIDVVVLVDIFIRIAESQPPLIRFLQEIELLQ